MSSVIENIDDEVLAVKYLFSWNVWQNWKVIAAFFPKQRRISNFHSDRTHTNITRNFVCNISHVAPKKELEMWANAQRDGRPAEYRWRPVFNTAKFGWRPLLQCHAVTLPRCETRWNLQGCPKLPDRSHPLVGRSSPYCGDMWRRYCCLTSFFPIVDMWLSCEDIARQSCAMVP